MVSFPIPARFVFVPFGFWEMLGHDASCVQMGEADANGKDPKFSLS